jgi:hypothetical protein
MVDKGLLQKVKGIPIFGQALYGYYLGPLHFRSKRKAAANGYTIAENRTAAANPFTAALFCACQLQLLPQDLEQGTVGGDI